MTGAASAAALTDEQWEAEWSSPVVLLSSRRRRSRRNELEEQRALAQHAQQLRAERATGGYRRELRGFFGDPAEPAAELVERRITRADFERELRLEREYAAELPLVHGTAAAHKVCAGPGERRCDACRAYQTERSRRNRADRRARDWCTGTRSSYDAGCRCERCTAANSTGCADYRRRVS